MLGELLMNYLYYINLDIVYPDIRIDGRITNYPTTTRSHYKQLRIQIWVKLCRNSSLPLSGIRIEVRWNICTKSMWRALIYLRWKELVTNRSDDLSFWFQEMVPRQKIMLVLIRSCGSSKNNTIQIRLYFVIGGCSNQVSLYGCINRSLLQNRKFKDNIFYWKIKKFGT